VPRATPELVAEAFQDRPRLQAEAHPLQRQQILLKTAELLVAHKKS